MINFQENHCYVFVVAIRLISWCIAPVFFAAVASSKRQSFAGDHNDSRFLVESIYDAN